MELLIFILPLIGLSIVQLVMLFCLPFFVYRIRKETIAVREELVKIRKQMIPEDIIELTDVVK